MKKSALNIQVATYSDIPAIVSLFQQTVLQITADDYNAGQRHAWAARGADVARLENRINTQYFLTVKYRKQLRGFGSITNEGCLDVLYVHHSHQNEGVATALLQGLGTWAIQQKLTEIVTYVSLTARTFFQHQGYSIVEARQSVLENQVLTNYMMKKIL